MTFQPVLAGSGLSGWRFLQRTLPAQQEVFARTPALQRDAAQFRERIGQVTTASALVDDRALLRVALGAFGLDSEVNNRAFLLRVFGDDPADPGALVNRLADKRFLAASRAFRLWPGGVPATLSPGFADRILPAHQTRQFEIAVGAQDNSMRLALTTLRELPELAARPLPDETLWLSVMGSPPLRAVLEQALNLPGSLATLDLDQQLDVFQSRARSALGVDRFAELADPRTMDTVLRRFLVRAEAESGAAGSGAGSVALQLLQSVRIAPLGPRRP